MDIDILIAKYLNGESEPEETGELIAWRKLSPENELIFRQSEDAWQLTDIRELRGFNKERTWKNIQNRISRLYSLAALLRVAGIAASITLVLGWTLTRIFTDGRKDKIAEQPQLITLYVPAGVYSKTVLPDSTVVWLNASSTMRYPNYFDGDTRTIELIGEAFFDVSRDETKPFIIHSGNLQVNVLGTSFNFKHYAEDTHAVLAVETGAVTLSAGAATLTTLQAGKYAMVHNQTLQTKIYNMPQVNLSQKNNPSPAPRSGVNDKKKQTDLFSSWRNNTMIFRDEPFGNVLNELSRRYNAEFELRGNDIRHYVYTATFDNMSLEDVLNLLKMSSPIDYSMTSLTRNTSNAYGTRKVIIFQK